MFTALNFWVGISHKTEAFLIKTNRTHTLTQTHTQARYTQLKSLTSFLTQPQSDFVYLFSGNLATCLTLLFFLLASFFVAIFRAATCSKVKVFNHMSSVDLTWVRGTSPVGFFDSCRTWLINVGGPFLFRLTTAPETFACDNLCSKAAQNSVKCWLQVGCSNGKVSSTSIFRVSNCCDYGA